MLDLSNQGQSKGALSLEFAKFICPHPEGAGEPVKGFIQNRNQIPLNSLRSPERLKPSVALSFPSSLRKMGMAI